VLLFNDLVAPRGFEPPPLGSKLITIANPSPRLMPDAVFLITSHRQNDPELCFTAHHSRVSLTGFF
jgi:hypothetical protein